MLSMDNESQVYDKVVAESTAMVCCEFGDLDFG